MQIRQGETQIRQRETTHEICCLAAQFQRKISFQNYGLPPISMMITEKNFSHQVFAETFPNPTVVSEVQQKYKAVM